jgi:hypothetical protein
MMTFLTGLRRVSMCKGFFPTGTVSSRAAHLQARR